MSYRSIYTGQQMDLLLSQIQNMVYVAGSFTVANLPTNLSEGSFAFATNGRKAGELAGAGTGVPVYFSHGSWRVFSNDSAVQV